MRAWLRVKDAWYTAVCWWHTRRGLSISELGRLIDEEKRRTPG